MRCKGPSYSKFFPMKLPCFRVRHLPMCQSLARDSASGPSSPRGTGTGAEPLATVFLLEASRFPLHSRAPALGRGANACTKGFSPDGASDSKCQWPQGRQIGSDSSDGSRSPKMLGGFVSQQFWKRGSSPQGKPPFPETEIQTSLDQGKPFQPHPFLASLHLEVKCFGSRGSPRHPREAAIRGRTACGMISDSIGVPSPFSPE